LRYLLNNVEKKSRTLCETQLEMVTKLRKNMRLTTKLLKPKNGAVNLANLF